MGGYERPGGQPTSVRLWLVRWCRLQFGAPQGARIDRAFWCYKTLCYIAKRGRPLGVVGYACQLHIASSGQTLQLATFCICSCAAAGMPRNAMPCTAVHVSARARGCPPKP